ncbi:MAG: hypothetical protein ABDH49_00680 [Candidatus Hydrothermales bacterium]
MKEFFTFLAILIFLFRSDDFDKFVIKEGFFRSNLVKYENPTMIKRLTKKIEKNYHIFTRILNLLSIEKKDVKISYYSAFLTEDNKEIIIVYFIDLQDLVLRGIKVEFTYNLEKKRFEKVIYYIKVPYE